MTNLNEPNEEGVVLLKENGIKKYAEVWTADEVSLGQALHLYHRLNNVNPEMRLYASYLESSSVQMGGSVFIPTNFIEEVDPKENKIILSVKIGTVKHETWDRTPNFIAHHMARVEELAT